MTYLLIAGIVVFGYLLPEFLLLLGSGSRVIPLQMNVVSAVAAGMVAVAVLL